MRATPAPAPRQPRASPASMGRRPTTANSAASCRVGARRTARRRRVLGAGLPRRQIAHAARALARLRRHKGKLVHLTNVVQTYFGNLMAEFEGDLANIHSLEEKQAPLGARGGRERCALTGRPQLASTRHPQRIVHTRDGVGA